MDEERRERRRHRTIQAQQKRREAFQLHTNRRRMEIQTMKEALARKRAAMESARAATQVTASVSSSRDTANPTTSFDPPSVYTSIESTFDDELIQPSIPISPAFASMPVDLHSPIILEVAQQPRDFEATGGAQPLSPGGTSQLSQVEKDSRRELRRMDGIVEATQVQLLQEFKERKAPIQINSGAPDPPVSEH
jgi:hypothetical protein